MKASAKLAQLPTRSVRLCSRGVLAGRRRVTPERRDGYSGLVAPSILFEMTTPWNGWYHCNGNTYGTWLRGDPRGFRERHHRRHVEGDYRNPPAPGEYGQLHERSKEFLKREPVHLNGSQREVAARAMLDKLRRDGIDVIAISVDDHHFHVLLPCPDHRPRQWLGRAKMHASMELRELGLHGQVWARGCRALPIRDRGHQVNTFDYIVDHRRREAAVWTFRDLRP